MLHCPSCGYEYEVSANRCPDCGNALQPGPLPAGANGDFRSARCHLAVQSGPLPAGANGDFRSARCHLAVQLGPLPAGARGWTANGPLTAVAAPADEPTALLFRDILKGNSIPAAVRCLEMPWYDGLASLTMNRGVWGQVLVREADADRARRLLADYATGAPREPDGDEDGGGDDHAFGSCSACASAPQPSGAGAQPAGLSP